MPILFTPRSEEECDSLRNPPLLPEGEYKFSVSEIDYMRSQAGNDMIVVTLSIPDGKGTNRTLTDYLVIIDKMIFKFKHFCDTLGFSKEYESGKFEPDHAIGKIGKALIAIEKGKERPDGSGKYPDKNVIKDYVKKDPNEFFDDKIPF